MHGATQPCYNVNFKSHFDPHTDFQNQRSSQANLSLLHMQRSSYPCEGVILNQAYTFSQKNVQKDSITYANQPMSVICNIMLSTM